MTGKNIIDVILENKEKIKYIGYTFPDIDTSGYYKFKFYFNTKNIFGFRKYLDIICWDDIERYDMKDPLDIRIEIPSWNIFKYNDYIDVKDIKLSTELKNIYDRYVYNDINSSWIHLGEVLDKNLNEKK